jgi:hypothetical protein
VTEAPVRTVPRERLIRVVDLIRQRQSLYRLSFEKPRVTRAILYQQARSFENWLDSIAEDIRNETGEG